MARFARRYPAWPSLGKFLEYARHTLAHSVERGPYHFGVYRFLGVAIAVVLAVLAFALPQP